MQFMAMDTHVKNVQAHNGYEDIFLSLMADYRAGLAPGAGVPGTDAYT